MSQRPSRGNFWKSDQKVVMGEKINPRIVMDEELVQNDVMDGKFVKNFVMNFVLTAKSDPKVVMGLSVFKIGGWNSLQPSIKICWRNLLMRMNRGC